MRMLFAIVLLMLVCAVAYAAPVAVAGNSEVTVTLTDEDCALGAVKNLPYRATWVEAKGSFEGCYDVRRDIVVIYFEDKQVVVVPLGAFRKPGTGI